MTRPGLIGSRCGALKGARVVAVVLAIHPSIIAPGCADLWHWHPVEWSGSI
jgi:hypothetical protein